MQIIVNPEKREWAALTARPQMERSTIGPRVAAILDAVRAEGDDALLRLTREIDGVKLPSPAVTADEIEEASRLVPQELKTAIATAKNNIERFHAAQQGEGVDLETMPGVRCVQKAVPIRSVGLYIPGGSAPLFSTVLMLAIPARIAGCPQITLCSPPDKQGKLSPAILYTAQLCGVTHIFKAGGAQAVAAMAYGTQSIPKADKIFGPGNQYVTEAKQQVSQFTAIDMPAGPSEVLVMADETADPAFVASDLLSQAEHGPDSQAMLVASSRALAERVVREVERQLAELPREAIASRALDHSRIIVMDTPEEMVEFANAYAAEHLIISMRDAWEAAAQITAAGSVFIGPWSPESAGDYASGTNHTLPTGGCARAYSGVNIDSFLRREHPRFRLASAHVGSLGGLMALKRHQCHLAGSHLLNDADGVYNRQALRDNLQGEPMLLVRLVDREQGLIVAPGNPLGIHDIADLAREDVRFINRQRGAGTRILLDWKLKQAGLKPSDVKGYDKEEFTHMAVAVNVLTGAADCGMGIYAAAKALGLDFVPLALERYDLVIPTRFLDDPRVQAVRALLDSPAFKARIEAQGGYDTPLTGQIMAEGEKRM